MERREMGLPNSMGNYNVPQQQSPPVKLPLAPIFSTPPERRANAMVSTTRRGSSIFSPATQTLDHHLNPPADPDPAPTAVPITTGGASNPKNPAPSPKPTSNNTSTTSIKYRECLKNHAASMGGHIVDGCGEFMPSGDDDSPESLRCAACDCHRNFHRKEINGGETQQYDSNHHRKTPTIIHKQATMVNFGGAAAESSCSEDLNMFQSGSGGHAVMQHSKKRFRTKFSQDQKHKMNEFASKIEWRIQKQNEEDVQHFCSEVGVKRQVFKVWMHNNKQAIKKTRQSSDG